MALPTCCPLCSASSDKLSVITQHVSGSIKSDDHAFFKCLNCDVIFQYPYYTETQLEEFYIKEFESFMHKRSGSQSNWQLAESHNQSNISTFNRRMDYLDQHLFPEMSVLEVGCSSGFMLLPLRDRGYNCFGVEPSDVFSKFLIDKGIMVFNNQSSLRLCSDQKFDLICHFFVLEHVRDPVAFLQEQLSLCKNNGKVIFEIPSYSDALVQIYDIPEFERFYWSKPHPWYFNYSSIKHVLESLNCNFSIKPYQRYDLSNHLSWALNGLPGGQSRFSDKFGVDLENLYRESLVTSGYYDTIIVTIEND